MIVEVPHAESDEDARTAPGAIVGVILTLLVIGGLLAGVVMLSGSAAGQTANGTENETEIGDKAPYYEGNHTVANESWMDGRENATLPNVLHMATRFGTFIVGGGQAAQDDIGPAGPLIVGAVFMGVMLGAVVGAGVGMVGGGVLSIVAVVMLTTIDAAPEWLYAVTLFGLGIVLAAVIKDALR